MPLSFAIMRTKMQERQECAEGFYRGLSPMWDLRSLVAAAAEIYYDEQDDHTLHAELCAHARF